MQVEGTHAGVGRDVDGLLRLVKCGGVWNRGREYADHIFRLEEEGPVSTEYRASKYYLSFHWTTLSYVNWR